MALARRTPTGGLSRWEPGREFQRLFEEFFGRGEGEESGWLTGTWAPPVDLFETDDAFMLKAELPGLTKDDIHIDVHERTLTLRGERKHETEVKRDHYHRQERAYGSFQRSFWLPTMVNVDNVQASFKDGVLELRLPKHEAAKPKHIPITT
jgi:HSP20 family protein